MYETHAVTHRLYTEGVMCQVEIVPASDHLETLWKLSTFCAVLHA